jgi:hypothetical protein
LGIGDILNISINEKQAMGYRQWERIAHSCKLKAVRESKLQRRRGQKKKIDGRGEREKEIS